MSSIRNKIYFQGHAADDRDNLTSEDVVKDTTTQKKMSRLLNCSPDVFAAKVKKNPELLNLTCRSPEIMNRFWTRKMSIK
jgi:hypothetical protein